MASRVTVDIGAELTIVTLWGDLSSQEIIDIMNEYYEKDSPTKNLLYDARQATIEFVPTIDIERIMDHAKDLAVVRPRGSKTAMVAGKELEYGIGRMVQTFAEIRDMEVEFMVFKSLPKALEWLGCHDE